MSSQKTVIVTGASRGLGLNVSQRLVKSGAQVCAISRRSSSELDSLLNDYPDLIRFTSFDFSNPEEITTSWLQNILPDDLPIHGLVNNAATAYDDLVSNMQLDSLESQFRVNVFSPMLLTKLLIRRMILHKTSGSIVHVSSISTQTGYKGLSMYAATKGAIEAFSKNTAREWGARNIRSNCVIPGFMETKMSSNLDNETKARIYKRSSLNQPTSLDSVAETILFMLSDSSHSMTGQNVIVDSGTI